jgi:hypothetical protein
MPWSDLQGVRLMLRAAGITSLSTLGLAVLAYCVLWRLPRYRRLMGGSSLHPDAMA